MLAGQVTIMESLPDYLFGDYITFFEYAPITSIDIERSFQCIIFCSSIIADLSMIKRVVTAIYILIKRYICI